MLALGRSEEAAERLRTALEEAELVGHDEGMADVLLALARAADELGQSREAAEHRRRADHITVSQRAAAKR